MLAAMKLRGLSIYSSPRAPASHSIPTAASEVGGRHPLAATTCAPPCSAPATGWFRMRRS
jgi:hypothetical protein